MNKEFTPDRLDVAAFAAAGAVLAADDPLSAYERLAHEAAEDTQAPVRWQAQGEARANPGGEAMPWLHLAAQATVPLVCQRCLSPVATPLQVDRWFRFVADEATAEAEDEASEEDVLVVRRDFDLRELVEDELLMALPVAPRHEACPVQVPLSAVDPDFEAAEAARPNPFAALDALRRKSE